MDEQVIKLRRGASIYNTRELAIEALNAQKFFYGIPVVVKYKVGEEINALLAIGVTEAAGGEAGANSYRIVSDSKATDITDDMNKYQSEIQDLTMPNAVGGISAGTSIDDLRGQTYTKLFDDLLFPTIIPVIANKGGLSLARNPNTALFEVGASQQFTFTPNFNRGSFTLNGQPVSGKYYLGAATNYEYFKGSQSVQTGNTNTYTVTEKIVKGVTTFKVTATYGNGDIPSDNKGTQHPELQGKAGTKDATVSVEGTYPWFATSATTGTFTKQPIRSLTANSVITLHLAPGNGTNPQSIKFPAEMRQPKSMKLLNNLSGKYDIDEPLGNYTKSDVQESVNGSNVGYKLFAYNGGSAGPVRGEVNLQISF